MVFPQLHCAVTHFIPISIGTIWLMHLITNTSGKETHDNRRTKNFSAPIRYHHKQLVISISPSSASSCVTPPRFIDFSLSFLFFYFLVAASSASFSHNLHISFALTQTISTLPLLLSPDYSTCAVIILYCTHF